MSKTIIELLSAMESKGIKVTLGECANFIGQGKSVYLRWQHPLGAISETMAFDDYSQLEQVLSESRDKLMERIKAIIQGVLI